MLHVDVNLLRRVALELGRSILEINSINYFIDRIYLLYVNPITFP